MTLTAIESSVRELATKINASQDLLPTFGYSIDGGHPHVEIGESRQLYYVVVERGHEEKRYHALDLDDLLFQIFVDISFSMAVDYELKHRIKEQDFRRILFSRQEEILGILSEKWQKLKHNDHLITLTTYPFDDTLSK